MQHDSAQLRFAHQMLLGFLPECGAARGALESTTTSNDWQQRWTSAHQCSFLTSIVSLLFEDMYMYFFINIHTSYMYVGVTYVYIHLWHWSQKTVSGIPEKTTAKLIPKNGGLHYDAFRQQVIALVGVSQLGDEFTTPQVARREAPDEQKKPRKTPPLFFCAHPLNDWKKLTQWFMEIFQVI